MENCARRSDSPKPTAIFEMSRWGEKVPFRVVGAGWILGRDFWTDPAILIRVFEKNYVPGAGERHVTRVKLPSRIVLSKVAIFGEATQNSVWPVVTRRKGCILGRPYSSPFLCVSPRVFQDFSVSQVRV